MSTIPLDVIVRITGLERLRQAGRQVDVYAQALRASLGRVKEATRMVGTEFEHLMRTHAHYQESVMQIRRTSEVQIERIRRVTERMTKDVFRMIMSLLGVMFAFTSYMRQIQEASGEMDMAMMEVRDTLGELWSAIGDLLAPLLRAFIPIIEKITDIFEALPDPLKTLIAGLFLFFHISHLLIMPLGSIVIMFSLITGWLAISTIKMKTWIQTLILGKKILQDFKRPMEGVTPTLETFMKDVGQSYRNMSRLNRITNRSRRAFQRFGTSVRRVAGRLKGLTPFMALMIIPTEEAFRIFEALGRLFSAIFGPILTRIADWIEDLADSVEDATAELDPFLHAMYTVIGAFMIFGGVILSVLGQFYAGIPLLMAGVYLLTRGLGVILPELTYIFDKIKIGFSEIIKSMEERAKDLELRGLISIFGMALLAMMIDIETFIEFFKDQFGKMVSWFDENITKPLVEGSRTFLEGWSRIVSLFISNVIYPLAGTPRILQEAWSVVPLWFDTNVISKLVGSWIFFEQFLRDFDPREILARAWYGIQLWFKENVTDKLTGVWEGFISWMGDIPARLSELVIGLGTAIATWFLTYIVQPLETQWKNFCKWMGDIPARIGDIAEAITTWFNDYVVTPITTAWGEFSLKVTEIFNVEGIVTWFEENVISPIRTAWETFVGIISGLIPKPEVPKEVEENVRNTTKELERGINITRELESEWEKTRRQIAFFARDAKAIGEEISFIVDETGKLVELGYAPRMLPRYQRMLPIVPIQPPAMRPPFGQEGGIVTREGLIYLHEGEIVTPRERTEPIVNNFYITATIREEADITLLAEEINRLQREGTRYRGI